MATPSQGHRVGFLAPMPTELKPLVRMAGLIRTGAGGAPLYEGGTNGVDVVATMTGIGTAAAAEAAERLLDVAAPHHVVVVGIAGGVDPARDIGDVLVPERVMMAATGATYEPALLDHLEPGGVLMTTDEFIVDPARLDRLVAEGVTALDMETAAVAEVCVARGCPWSVVRAISDRPSDGLVDESILGLARPDGRPDLGAVARYLLVRPWRLPRLMRIARDAQRAADAAAKAAIASCLRPPA